MKALRVNLNDTVNAMTLSMRDLKVTFKASGGLKRWLKRAAVFTRADKDLSILTGKGESRKLDNRSIFRKSSVNLLTLQSTNVSMQLFSHVGAQQPHPQELKTSKGTDLQFLPPGRKY